MPLANKVLVMQMNRVDKARQIKKQGDIGVCSDSSKIHILLGFQQSNINKACGLLFNNICLSHT